MVKVLRIIFITGGISAVTTTAARMSAKIVKLGDFTLSDTFMLLGFSLLISIGIILDSK